MLCDWIKPPMFCKESSGKIVGPRILLLQSIVYFGTSEHYWVVEKKKKESCLAKLLWLGVMDFHCMLLWWACGLVSARIEDWDAWKMMCHVNHFLISGNDVISQESRPLNIRVFIHIYSLQLQTYFRSLLTRVLNQFKYQRR